MVGYLMQCSELHDAKTVHSRDAVKSVHADVSVPCWWSETATAASCCELPRTSDDAVVKRGRPTGFRSMTSVDCFTAIVLSIATVR